FGASARDRSNPCRRPPDAQVISPRASEHGPSRDAIVPGAWHHNCPACTSFRPSSALGLVSRASPVQTAVRNCTRDEGGPFGFGDQVADPKPPQAAVVKSHGGERCGNAGTKISAGTVERGERKRTVSEVSK